ncbi:hypothetical protein [Nocardioides iriomotensis]|uniref:Uncharacterized protein n=1 Tax=Nocardioides iriomotensis TaxID=715784 RepID=A0A4Q5JC41_9ACTN|nr:hypothetical protein [Nocardioides iriomotensis]RYU15551.1 hypothetical protein ETU37_00050 [Nocardioides iriomotensis]
MTDQYGVPESMFGPVPEEFYGLVGRVVMVSTLVEDRTLMLLWALDDQPQPTHAGKPFWQLRQLIEQRLDDVASDLRAEIAAVMSRVSEAMDRRNGLVHSLWPNPSLEEAQGWRSKRVPNGTPGGSEIVWTPTSEQAMAGDLLELVELNDEIARLANLVWAQRSNNRSSLGSGD